ncbi:MAG: glycosyl transferase, partial [Eudoraea sp.]|nr:glycosyl transferase [Eudoraea sp.]
MSKTILQINTTAGYGSTGRIVNDLGDLLIDKGYESYIAYGRKEGHSKSKLLEVGNLLDTYYHVLTTRVLD